MILKIVGKIILAYSIYSIKSQCLILLYKIKFIKINKVNNKSIKDLFIQVGKILAIFYLTKSKCLIFLSIQNKKIERFDR